MGERDKPAFYTGARALLFPSDWPEPFGLVMIEALAAGTPVIALRRGSVPEVLVDGVTGFICGDVDEMVAAVDRLDEIDPDACRTASLEFTAEKMCRRYVEAYEQLQQRRRPLLAHV
jgi:glycosyltransferase involved in cell wall biosynthesis